MHDQNLKIGTAEKFLGTASLVGIRKTGMRISTVKVVLMDSRCDYRRTPNFSGFNANIRLPSM